MNEHVTSLRAASQAPVPDDRVEIATGALARLVGVVVEGDIADDKFLLAIDGWPDGARVLIDRSAVRSLCTFHLDQRRDFGERACGSAGE